MTVEEKVQNQQEELEKALWSIANTLRGNMDANDFKDYILGLIFYRFLSENLVYYVEKTLLRNQSYEDMFKLSTDAEKKDFINDLIEDENLGYYIAPEFLWKNLIKEIKCGNFDITRLSKAINMISDSTIGNESEDNFANLFDDMDLNSTKLGKGESDRTKLISKVMLKINDIEFIHQESEIDILGNAYEYLISNFAASAGKKAGEFYTPQQVSKILAKIVTFNKPKIQSIYDPTCGSGSLLLRVGKESKVVSYYGQESISTTYNLARMNMLLHGISFKHFDIKNGDTLEKPLHLDKKFDAIVANPPYSASWTASADYIEDERFSDYGVLAPTKPADFAFVQHMLYQLSDNGTMAVVLPHGVLFRPKSEYIIRRHLIEKYNCIDTIISLPKNIFFGTKQATIIMVFKKCRENDDSILYIDASKNFEKGTQNIIRDEDIDKIIDTYQNRKEDGVYSKNVPLSKVIENDFDLSISKYIELEIVEKNKKSKDGLNKEIKLIDEKLKNLNFKIEAIENELNSYADRRFHKEDGSNYGDWEYQLLSDILIEQKEKNGAKNLMVCSVAVEKGVINQIEHLGRSYAASDTSKYKVVHYGDIIYTKSPTGKFPYGIVKQSQLKDDVVVSPLYAIYKPKNYYIGYLLHQYFCFPNNTNEYLHNLIHKGAKNTININNDEFISKGIRLPIDEEEQEKLANYFILLSERNSLNLKKNELYSELNEIYIMDLFEK